MEQSATQSIEKVNGMLLNGKKVFVGRFVGRKDREKELGQKAKLYTNVYIKNLDENVNDKELFEMFEKYGTITSFKVNILGLYDYYCDFIINREMFKFHILIHFNIRSCSEMTEVPEVLDLLPLKIQKRLKKL